jgi:hypothetical protein
MTSTKRFIFGGALVLGLARLALFLVRINTPRAQFVAPNPEEVSQRNAEKGEQRVLIAKRLDASEIDVEDRQKLDEAKGDAMRVLREVAGEASRAGQPAVSREALALEQALLHDARTTCSLGALKKLDAVTSALSPDARAPFTERLSVVERHVKRTCELATR